MREAYLCSGEDLHSHTPGSLVPHKKKKSAHLRLKNIKRGISLGRRAHT